MNDHDKQNEMDLRIAHELKELNELRHRVGERDSDYLEQVYAIYDIMREYGVKI